MSAFMKKWSETEHTLRTNIIIELEKSSLDIDLEHRGEIETLLSDAADSRHLRKQKIGATKYQKTKIFMRQSKNFDRVRNTWSLLKNRLEQSCELSSFDNMVEEYLNHWSARINKSNIQKEIDPQEFNNSSVRRFDEERREKRATRHIHVNEEVYSDLDDEDLFNPIDYPHLYEEITAREAHKSKDTVFIVDKDEAA
ncbi:MAG: hypothetical protein ACI9TY_001402 [Alphaproteobacteria bacterium]|jgi:uncharacterized protein YozE (UPF0346 family)